MEKITRIQEKIPAVECPFYVKDWIYKWSGIEFQDMTLQEVAVLQPKTFLVDENFIIKNMEKVFQIMEYNNIKKVVIHALHIYKFNQDMLNRLDQLAVGKEVHFISMSHKVNNLSNVIVHSHDIVEHGISHDFNYILSKRLHEKRNPHLDFIFMVNTKNQFRIDISNALLKAGILKNSFVRNGGQNQSEQLHKKQSQLLELIGKQFPGNLCLDALRSWGGALPNLRAYEQAFCEIVIESANGGFDKTHNTNFSDLSEKTYRPISLGVPFVFLGSKTMFDKLLDDGYQLLDDGFFYSKWHSVLDSNTGICHLIDFLKKIIVDGELKEKLRTMAMHNYKNFWTSRKLHHRKHNQQICKDCFGESPFDRIYDLLQNENI